MSYPLIALIVLLVGCVIGCILLAVFAWGEWNDNPHPEDDYEGF